MKRLAKWSEKEKKDHNILWSYRHLALLPTPIIWGISQNLSIVLIFEKIYLLLSHYPALQPLHYGNLFSVAHDTPNVCTISLPQAPPPHIVAAMPHQLMDGLIFALIHTIRHGSPST
jgi:hypothetical protein